MWQCDRQYLSGRIVLLGIVFCFQEKNKTKQYSFSDLHAS